MRPIDLANHAGMITRQTLNLGLWKISSKTLLILGVNGHILIRQKHEYGLVDPAD